MNTEKDGLSLEIYTAILKLKAGGTTRSVRTVWFSAFDLEDAQDSAETICRKITPNWPDDCVDPKDYPMHPVWVVSSVMGDNSHRIDLTLETSFEKLDPEWLKKECEVLEDNEYWLKAGEEAA